MSWIHIFTYINSPLLVTALTPVATVYRDFILCISLVIACCYSSYLSPFSSHSLNPFCLTPTSICRAILYQSSNRGQKGTSQRKKSRGGMNQKARKWSSLYKRRGNFNVCWCTEELCLVLAGCGVKRAAATAGYIYSDKFLQTLKSPSKVYLFKRQ